MSNELIKEKIVLTNNIGKEITQVLLEGDIIVPDVKPDISLILKTDADVIIDKNDVSSDRINYSGKLNIRILYLAKGAEKSIHSISASAPIDDFLNMEGVNRDMWISLVSKITNIDYRILNDRKIGYRAVIDLNISAEAKVDYDVVTNIGGLPEAQLRKTVLSINKTADKKDDRFIVKDELPVPPGKPNIRELLQTSIIIANKEIKVTNGRVGISGELVVSTLYKGDDEESIIEFVEHELPFNGSIDVGNAKEGMFGDVHLNISDQYVQARPDADGEDRVLEIEVSISASIKVASQEELEILDDAYCINKKLDIKKEKVAFPRLICRNKNQFPVKEVVQVDNECPGMLQIFRVCGDAQLDDVKIIDDKVVVEGVICADILYIANSDDAPLYNFKAVLPYKQVIETKGALAHMDADVELSIDHIGFNMLSEKEVELRFILNFNTKVADNMEAGVITDIEFDDLDKTVIDKMPSMVIYVVQKGDSLWSIAKKYNASLEELVEINEIENPELIYPGQKLLVIKKITE